MEFMTFPSDWTQDFIRRNGTREVDGILLSAPDVEDILEEVAKTDIPTVLFNINISEQSAILKRKTGIRILHHNSAEIGHLAAHHLLSMGSVRTYLYIRPKTNYPWSAQREAEFAQTLKTFGFTAISLASSPEGTDDLPTRLRKFPGPLGIFAANDRVAVQACNACRSANLSIPRDAMLIGVDDDEGLCTSVSPSLSSITTDSEALGYEAAQILDDLMSHRNRQSRHITLSAKSSVVMRDSSRPTSDYGQLVSKALAIIDQKATDGITPDDIAAQLHVSRRLLDLRFREIRKGTISESLRHRKLEEVRRLLTESDSQIETITELCGFGSANNLKKLFHAQYGMSMRDWRKKGYQEKNFITELR